MNDPWSRPPDFRPHDAAPDREFTPESHSTPGGSSYPPYGSDQPSYPSQGFQSPGSDTGPWWQPPGPDERWGVGQPPAIQSAVPVRRRGWATTLVLACLCLLLGLVGGLAGSQLGNRFFNPPVEIPIATGTAVQREPGSVAGVAAKVLPSTVSIEVTTPQGRGFGSGFVMRSDGLILTNNHVVGGAQPDGVRVIFSDGSQQAATIVGRTVAYDLAVLRVNRQGLPALTLGDSDAVVVGDPVIAVGAPLGLQSTVTSGIVSALHRPVVAGENNDRAFISAIQTDAAINPGNSGGPLVNAQGEVIGINSAIARLPNAEDVNSGSIGLGFAIPSTQAARTAEQLISTGKATYPVIGVVLDRDYVGEGVRVATEPTDGNQPVTPDGPAARAGIRPGDVITRFQGRPVTEPNELIVGIRAEKPGDQVRLTVQRDGKGREVTVTLSETESN